MGTRSFPLGTEARWLPPLVLRFMDCRTFRSKHFAFVDDTLPGVDVVAMERHRQQCAACARMDADVRRSLLLIRNNLAVIEPSPDFADRLAKRLEAERRRAAAPAPFFRGPGIRGFLSMSVSVVALGVLALTAFDGRGGEQAVRLPSVVLRPAHGVDLGLNAALPAAPPAFVASVSTGMAIWPALMLMEEAQERFAGDDPTAPARPVNYVAASEPR